MWYENNISVVNFKILNSLVTYECIFCHFYIKTQKDIFIHLFAARNILFGVTAVHLVSCVGMLVKIALEIAGASEFYWNRLLVYEIGRELYNITFYHKTFTHKIGSLTFQWDWRMCSSNGMAVHEDLLSWARRCGLLIVIVWLVLLLVVSYSFDSFVPDCQVLLRIAEDNMLLEYMYYELQIVTRL